MYANIFPIPSFPLEPNYTYGVSLDILQDSKALHIFLQFFGLNNVFLSLFNLSDSFGISTLLFSPSSDFFFLVFVLFKS